jgi:hypothetical protein
MVVRAFFERSELPRQFGLGRFHARIVHVAAFPACPPGSENSVGMRLRAQITGATASRWAARFAPDRVKKAKRCALRLFAPKAVREESFGRPRAFLRKLHEARRS